MKANFKQKLLFRSPFANIACTKYSEGFIMEPHDHKETQISFIIHGSNHEKSEITSTHYGRPTEVIIKPKGLIHNNTFSNDCTILTIQLKEENHTKLHNDGMLKEWRSLSCNGSYQLLSSIMHCRKESEYYAHLNKVLSTFDRAGQSTIDGPPDWLVEVKLLLESSFHSVIKNEEIGISFNKHPIYIARMFKRYFGMSMKQYVKLLRTNAAMNSIVSEEDILAGIALKNGFTDQSHLNRIFKSQTGFTPNEFKNLLT